MSGSRTQALIRTILENRGIPLDEQARFIRPDFEKDQHDAATMLGMSAAVTRIIQAIDHQEHILVFGDYDADGVPATALLERAFRGLGVTVTPLVPTRASGYGLTPEAVQIIAQLEPHLVITVDNGTVAKAEIAQLATLHIDVIVVDHHEPQEGQVAEAAVAILNPKQKDCPYPFKELCGCGLAWKLMDQLYLAMGKDRGTLKWLLDLVALSTIADMVPLVGENRLFAVFGLKVLRKTRNNGLKVLLESAGVALAEASATDVSFRLAPRINAPSRMHQEMLGGVNAALKLLTTADEKEARVLGQHLQQQNTDRQKLVDEHLTEADLQAQQQQDMLALVVYHEQWSTGIIGLVAGRLMEKHKRPVVALAKEGESVKGSVRTVDGVHALDLLTSAGSLLSRFGGHAKAAGLTLEGDISQLRKALHAWLKSQGMSLETLASSAEKKSEIELTLDDITLELTNALEGLEPFGVGFPTPLFCTHCLLSNIRAVGSDHRHLSCFLTDGKTTKKAIGFGLAHLNPDSNHTYEVCYTLGQETWQGVTSPTCFMQKLSTTSTTPPNP